MKAPADIVYQLLIDQTLGTDPVAEGVWPVFVGFLPDAPDEALCVYDTEGKPDGRLMTNGEQIEHPGIQIRARGKSYPDTYVKLRTIADTLAGLANVEVSLESDEVYTIQNLSRQGTILALGLDEEGGRRTYHFTLNFLLTLSQN